MLKYPLRAAVAFAALSLVAPLAQERVKPKGPTDFIKTCDELKTLWEEERYGTCIGKLRDMMSVSVEKREEKIVAALPVVEKFKRKPRPKNAATENPFAAVMATTVGSMIELGWADVARTPIILVSDPAALTPAEKAMADHPIVNGIIGWRVPDLDKAVWLVNTMLATPEIPGYPAPSRDFGNLAG